MPFIWPVNRKISDFRKKRVDESRIREREFTFESVLFGESIYITIGAIAKIPDFFYSAAFNPSHFRVGELSSTLTARIRVGGSTGIGPVLVLL